ILADAEQAALRTLFARQTVPLRAADGAQQYGIGFAGQLLGRFRIGIVGGIDRTAAEQRLFHLELEVERIQDADRLSGNFGTDAVTRQNTNLHSHSLLRKQPGLADTTLLFEFADLLGVAQGQADVVPAIDQTFLAERIDLEGNAIAVRADHGLRLEIDRQLIARRRLDLTEQGLDFGGRQHDRHDAVLVAVVEEDIGERFGNDRLEAEVEQRPRRVFA